MSVAGPKCGSRTKINICNKQSRSYLFFKRDPMKTKYTICNSLFFLAFLAWGQNVKPVSLEIKNKCVAGLDNGIKYYLMRHNIS